MQTLLRLESLAFLTLIFIAALTTAAPGQGGNKPTLTSSATQKDGFTPSVIRFGASVAETERALQGLCKKTTTRRIDPPFRVLRDIKDKQMQIDCDGFPFSGEPRWAEFVFGDDSLEMVWIMTAKKDQDPLLERMMRVAGAPDLRNEKFVAFSKGQIALRLDVPEVLFY